MLNVLLPQVQAFNLDGDAGWSSTSYALHTHAVPEIMLPPISLAKT